MQSFEIRLETEVKAFLQANFDDNPLKYWDKDNGYANIQLKDANTIVRVKPIRYNQQDELEFKVQLKELEDRQLAFKSSEENKALIVAQLLWLIAIQNRNGENLVW